MDGIKEQTTIPGRKLTIWGVLLLWGASIALALELKSLLTPGNYPVGSDPSVDISAAALFFFLCVLGGLLVWRGSLLRNDLQTRSKVRIVNIATFITVLFIIITGVAGATIYSANSAVSRQYQAYLPSRPSPDYSFAEFPTPALPRPTPTHNPGAKYMAGPLIYALDGLKAGDVWVSVSPETQTINSFQAYVDRIECSILENGKVATYAVEKSEQLLSGPVAVQNDRFYMAEKMAVLHGVVTSPDELHGTLDLRYMDPATGQVCDLGSFTWKAFPSGQSQ